MKSFFVTLILNHEEFLPHGSWIHDRTLSCSALCLRVCIVKAMTILGRKFRRGWKLSSTSSISSSEQPRQKNFRGALKELHGISGGSGSVHPSQLPTSHLCSLRFHWYASTPRLRLSLLVFCCHIPPSNVVFCERASEKKHQKVIECC
jgi:hypothetical protein